MSIFKSTFPAHVKKQLLTRENATIFRTPENLSYLNARSAWVRMSSSVNVNGTNQLAKKYILQGGTLNSDGTLKAGLGNNYNAYSTTSANSERYRLGIRPMPGITSVDVKSKTAYGSLREVIVNFNCWDIKQLEDLELLYMRPGYTVLVEWGWAPYLITGKYHSTFTDFYDIINSPPKRRTQLFQDLYNKSVKYEGNYDACFGYVKNYEWSARMDGGYDCKTTIITTGEIIESLKVNYIKPTAITATTGLLAEEFSNNGTTTGWVPAYSENALAGMWAEAYYKLNTTISPDVVIKAGSAIIEGGNINQAQFSNFYISSNTDNEKSLSRQNSNFQVYLTLPVVFELINRYIIAKSKSDGEGLITLSLKDRDGDDLLCLAHPLQVSVDPGICLIKSPKWYEEEGIIQKQIIEANKNSDVVATIEILKSVEMGIESLNSNKYSSAFYEIRTGLEKIKNKDQYIAVATKIQEKGYTIDGLFTKLVNNFTVGEDFNSFGRMLQTKKIMESNVDGLTIYFRAANKPTSTHNYAYMDVNNYETWNKSWQDFQDRNIISKGLFRISDYAVGPLSNVLGISTATQLDFQYIVEDYTKPEDKAEVDFSTVSFKTNFKIEANVISSQASIAANGPQALANLSLLKTLSRDYFVDYSDSTGNLQELGYLKGIYVNLDYLYLSALSADQQSSDDKGKEEISLYNYIKKLMQDIQSVTGNVNDFEIHVDPIDNNVARVIDIKYTEKNKAKSTNLYLLPVHQLGSTVRSYSLQSQIFPNQSALVAIGSQAKSSGALGIQANTMIDFNRRLTDRILTEKGDGTLDEIIASVENIEKQLININNGLSKVVAEFATLPKADNSSLPSYDTEISAAKTGLKDTIVQIQAITNSPGSNRNIIPTKFSCEIDGIGGLVIGNMFRLPNHVMPKGYRGENGVGVQLGNAVTGIAHTIKDGDWVTKIDSLNIVLDNPVEVLPIAQMATTALGNIAAAKLGTKASQ